MKYIILEGELAAIGSNIDMNKLSNREHRFSEINILRKSNEINRFSLPDVFESAHLPLSGYQMSRRHSNSPLR